MQFPERFSRFSFLSHSRSRLFTTEKIIWHRSTAVKKGARNNESIFSASIVNIQFQWLLTTRTDVYDGIARCHQHIIIIIIRGFRWVIGVIREEVKNLIHRSANGNSSHLSPSAAVRRSPFARINFSLYVCSSKFLTRLVNLLGTSWKERKKIRRGY